MGPLSFIVSPGKALEAFADALLPKELEFVGDLLGLATNLKTGNWAAALLDAVDFAENVLTGDLAPEKLKEGLKKLLSPQFGQLIDDLIDPGPPPPREPQAEGEVRVTKGATSFGQHDDERLGPAGAVSPETPTERSASATSSTGPGKKTTGSTKANRSSGKSSSTSRSSAQPATPSRAGSARPNRATAPAKTAAPGAKVAVDGKLAKYSDAQLLDMVRKGAIPEEITKDQGAMQGLQQRLHDIQQMNALLTNLARALHEMQMETIRNLRA